MKKLFAAILVFVLALTCCVPVSAQEGSDAQASSFGAYEHVFIFGIDGAGRFIRDAETPNFDRIFADGAVDYTARAETITISAPNWGSILTGVSHLKHGRTNLNTGKTERSSDTKYPSIYTYVRRAYPDAQLTAFGNWTNINHGIIENDINVEKYSYSGDDVLTDKIVEYIDAGNAPKLFFTQFDDVDHVGHEKGSKSPDYIRQIEITDGYLGKIHAAMERNGLLEDTLILVVADHGHLIIGGHFGLTMRETNVTVAAAGKTVAAGGTMDEITRNRDVAAIALYALGVERPDAMSARIPANLFVDVDGEERVFAKDPFDAIFSRILWIITLCTKNI